jgi:protein-disulfide isomerase
MDNPTPESNVPQPEPIKMPSEPPQETRRDDILVINQTTLYMFLTAIVFFAAGFIVAWLTFQTRADDIRSTASGAAREAIRTAIAELGNAPTPTTLPRQDVKFSDTMPSWGPADAKVTIVEFSDLQCPFCESFYNRAYQQIKNNYGDKIHFVFRHFPIPSLHPDAENASYAAECAKEQGRFWEFHNVVLSSNGSNLSRDGLIEHARTAQVANMDQFTQCLDTQKYKAVVQEDVKAGEGYYVNGTPTFFINGDILVGAQSYEVFKAKIDSELQSTGG